MNENRPTPEITDTGQLGHIGFHDQTGGFTIAVKNNVPQERYTHLACRIGAMGNKI